MLLSREGDLREAILMRQGKGWLQVPAMGHEALAAFALLLQPDDYIFPYYRDRPLMLARGLSAEQLALDFYAKAGSTSAGRNMPVHCTSRRLNIFSPATPTGAQCLPAVGAAWGMKRAEREQVVLCTIGDAAARQGEFFEAVCLAVQDSLPIVFLVEDNGYGISTPTERMMPFRLGVFSNELVVHFDGRRVGEVLDVGGRAIDQARAGHGPTLLWAQVDRLGSHTNSDDHRLYRDSVEIESMKERDPLPSFARELLGEGELTEQEWERAQHETREEIARLYEEVDREPYPDPVDITRHVLGSPVVHRASPVPPDTVPTTMVTAINRVLRAALTDDSRVLLFGQDIEDPKGGVFGFTKGLSTSFPGRVVNSPLAEATIVGTAVGLAAVGYRPVFEIQFIDFITPGFHQLVNQVANLRWRSHGEWSCPMVLYAPSGAYLPGGGIWHSQSNEGWWARLPGIRVAVPSTAKDAAGLFWAAIQDEDPSLILLPKHLARQRTLVDDYSAIPFGKGIIRREGKDVTLVTWGNGLELAEQAAEHLTREGVDLEIIDPRTLVPCDWELIAQSLAKTGRLVVVHEDSASGGFGQTIIAEMTSRAERFNTLLSPPQLVARAETPIPFCPVLEYAVLPDLKRVLAAVAQVME